MSEAGFAVGPVDPVVIHMGVQERPVKVESDRLDALEHLAASPGATCRGAFRPRQDLEVAGDHGARREDGLHGAREVGG